MRNWLEWLTIRQCERCLAESIFLVTLRCRRRPMWIAIGVVAAVLILIGLMYNSLVAKKNRVENAFAGIDVLVVPSIWLENAPFVIREAFTAGVPVVASDLGGMAEMVDHEVNGLLFTPGDADALGRALARLASEPVLVDRLRRGIPPVMTIEDDAAQLRSLYREQIASPSRRRLAAVVLNYRTPDDTVLAVRSLQSAVVCRSRRRH